MKWIFVILLSGTITVSAQQSTKSSVKNGRYSAQADSLRKTHQAKDKSDSLDHSQKDKMPIRKDTTGSTIPATLPKTNDHMPVMERSDTLK